MWAVMKMNDAPRIRTREGSMRAHDEGEEKEKKKEADGYRPTCSHITELTYLVIIIFSVGTTQVFINTKDNVGDLFPPPFLG